MTPEEQIQVNTLLGLLRDIKVVSVIQLHYQILHGNSAPAKLLSDQIKVVQKLLDARPIADRPRPLPDNPMDWSSTLREVFVKNASTYMTIGDLDKPFHRPSCDCDDCEHWRTVAGRPTHKELRTIPGKSTS